MEIRKFKNMQPIIIDSNLKKQTHMLIYPRRPLHLAVLQGFIEVVFSLVRILPDPRLLEIPNKYFQVCIFQKGKLAKMTRVLYVWS
jgi:hypothetical protein